MITIYGASDDLIEVEGDLNEEFNHYQEAPALLACSDGTLLRIASDREGVWRITRVAAGTSACTIDPGQDDRRHSDLVTLAGDIRWVVYADEGRDGRIVLARPVAGSQETTGPLIQPSVRRDPSKDVVALDDPEAVAESDARRAGTAGSEPVSGIQESNR